MNESLPLLWEGAPCGTISCCADAVRWRFVAMCDKPLRGICRAYLVGDEGERLLGVLAPDETGRFCTASTVTKMQLPRLDGFTHGEVRRSVGSWMSALMPETIFSDPALRLSLRGASGVLVDGVLPTRVAVVFDSHRPCPVAPAMCLARPLRYLGREYLVLGIDSNGNPVKCMEQTEGISV